LEPAAQCSPKYLEPAAQSSSKYTTKSL
jgi:hypothetical protein